MLCTRSHIAILQVCLIFWKRKFNCNLSMNWFPWLSEGGSCSAKFGHSLGYPRLCLNKCHSHISIHVWPQYCSYITVCRPVFSHSSPVVCVQDFSLGKPWHEAFCDCQFKQNHWTLKPNISPCKFILAAELEACFVGSLNLAFVTISLV